jgi:hypothetical protein
MKNTATIKASSLIFFALIVLALLSFSIPIPGKRIKKFAAKELTAMVPGEWVVKSVSVSLINGLCIGGVVGKPLLPISSTIEISASKIFVNVNLPALLKKKIKPSSIEIISPKIVVKLDGPSLVEILSSAAIIPMTLLVPVREIKVSDASFKFNAGLPHPVVMKITDLNIQHKYEGVGEGKFTLAEMNFGKTVYCNDFDGLFGGNVKDGNFSISGAGKALEGSIKANVDIANRKMKNVNLVIENAQLSEITLSKGKLVGRTSVTVGIGSLRESGQIGKASVKMSKFIAKDFPFQSLPHIEWLLPAVKVLSLDEVSADISFKNRYLDIVRFTGNGNGVRTDLAGRLDYKGSMKSDMTLYLGKEMVREIPYLTSKALPRNKNGEYVIPVSLNGIFPDLEVNVHVAFVTRAVGGILKDVINSFF